MISLGVYSFVSGAITLTAGIWAVYAGWQNGTLRLSIYMMLAGLMITLGIIALALAFRYFKKGIAAGRKQ